MPGLDERNDASTHAGMTANRAAAQALTDSAAEAADEPRSPENGFRHAVTPCGGT
jgi:hypothetical protein